MLSKKKRIKALAKVIDVTADVLWASKHGSHDQSTHGRGGPSRSGAAGAAGGAGKEPPKAEGGESVDSASWKAKTKKARLPEWKFKSSEDPKAYKPVNPKGKDSEGQHSSRTGGYSKARQALHKEIIDAHFQGKTPVSKPTGYLMGGGPASGKSGIIKSGQVSVPKNTVTIDSDHIKSLLPEYRKGVVGKDSTAAAFAHEESSYLSKQIHSKATKGSFNSLLDGTGDSGLDSLGKKVKKIRDGGGTVVAHYVSVPTKVAIKRNRKRAAKTGRLPPETMLKNTHKAVSAVVPKAIKAGLYDKITIWDTNGKPVKVASAEGTKLQIHDSVKFKRFTKKGKEVIR